MKVDLLKLAAQHKSLVAMLAAVNAALMRSSRNGAVLVIPNYEPMLSAVQAASAVCGGYAAKGKA